MLAVPIIYQVGFWVAMISRKELVVGWMHGILSILATAWHAHIRLQPVQHHEYLPYTLKQNMVD